MTSPKSMTRKASPSKGDAKARTSARATAAARRKAREQEIIAATRRLFDAGGVRDAQIEDIARAVGINRAIIYRHFTGKEELFALTLVGYLDELGARLATAGTARRSAIRRLDAQIGVFVDFGVEFPAFVDCAQTLMRRTGPELLEEISEGALLRLGRSMTGCLKQISDTLERGVNRGEFAVSDSDVLANYMYASALGALQLAHLGMVVKESTPGVPVIARIDAEQVKGYLMTSARALTAARGSRSAS